MTNIPHNSPADNSVHKPRWRQKDSLRSIVSTLALFIFAPIVAITITAFIFQSYEVDGPSMEKTLQNRDRLIVLKLPRTWAKITKNHYIPPRGSVIVFAKKGVTEEHSSNNKQLIKRVIALPGERIVVRDGKATVYNSAHPDGFNPDVDGGYPQITDATPGLVDLTLGEGNIFVMGDNRSDSLDSRSFGSIRAEEIVGRLSLRIIPLSKARSF